MKMRCLSALCVENAGANCKQGRVRGNIGTGDITSTSLFGEVASWRYQSVLYQYQRFVGL